MGHYLACGKFVIYGEGAKGCQGQFSVKGVLLDSLSNEGNRILQSVFH